MLCIGLSTDTVATSKASVYSVPLNQILLTLLGGVQPPHLLSFTTNLLMLIMILQKMFEICSLGHYCVRDTLQIQCSFAEYGFCGELLHVQSALKSHVRLQCPPLSSPHPYFDWEFLHCTGTHGKCFN